MADTIQTADEPIFKALLMPHRSLGRTGFLVAMMALLFLLGLVLEVKIACREV